LPSFRDKKSFSTFSWPIWWRPKLAENLGLTGTDDAARKHADDEQSMM